MIWHIDKDKFFYWILGITAASIALPANDLSSATIILLFVFWLFYNPWNEKFQILKGNLKLFLVLCIPFFIQVVGMSYSDNFYSSLLMAQLALPFIVYALTISAVHLEKKTFHFVMYNFVFGTLVASWMGLGKAIYYKMYDLGDYFFYSRFSELLGKHTTSFSLFIVISILFLFYEGIKKHLHWKLIVPVVLYFVVILYFISTRISIVALSLGFVILFITELKGKLKWLGIVLSFLVVGIFALPNFQKRFEPSGTEKGDISDLDFRKLHWKSVWETIEHQPLVLGAGSGSNRDYLYNRYRHYELTSAYELNYNAHNQALDYMLDFGMTGLVAFIFMMVYLGYYLLKQRNGIGLAIFAMIITYCITESLFRSQSGVVTFSLIMTLLLVCNPDREKS